ncbi:MAG: DUF1501 domain-containing protein [Pirellula sp.]
MPQNHLSLESLLTRDEIASRRAFMKFTGGCAALGSTSVLSQMLSLKLTQAAYADSKIGRITKTDNSPYRALVCIFLNGGIDTFNILTPYDAAEHAAYTAVRTTLAKPIADLLPIPVDIASPAGRKLGVNKSMPEVQTLYNTGKLAFIANVGSLVVPIASKTAYTTARKPLGLFSHADLIQHWQTSIPQSRSQASGWGGRMADLLTASHNPTDLISMNIALGSLNVFQTGTNVFPYVVGSTGAALPSGYSKNNTTGNNYDRVHNLVVNGSTGLNGIYPPADSALGAMYSDLLQRSLARYKRKGIDAAQGFFDATDNAGTGSTAGPLPAAIADKFTAIANDATIPSGIRGLAANLSMVARVIRARTAFAQTRQIFFVSVGGWDSHDNQIASHASMLPGVSKALDAFHNATVQLNVAENVTTFTASDFGRTLAPNSTGSDHAWGGNHMVMGGAVLGGKVYGSYPTSLALNNSLDLGRGRLIPTTSVDQYNAELATWFGIQNDSTLTDILPNVRNFYAANSATRPIGFLPPAT